MKFVFYLCLVLLTVCQMISCGFSSERSVVFRQHELEQLWRGGQDSDYIDSTLSEPEKVLNEIFKRLPPICKVYPTEGYYYFKARLLDGFVSGNFRIVVDSDSGDLSLSFAYFNIHDPRNFKSLMLLNGADVRIVPLPNGRYSVAIGDEVREFHDAGMVYRNAVGQVELYDNEDLVTGVMDESGVWFSLVFNKKTNYFYYLRNSSTFQVDRRVVLESIGKYQVVLDIGSGFVFLRDTTNFRELLVGVRRLEIQRNTFYDGPFDQVPPDLDIANMLRAAYPYVNAGLGIDKYGGFVERENMRVAISPYQVYSKIDDLINLCKAAIDSCDKFECVQKLLCYETKRDYHTAREDDGGVSMRKWPANHYATVSYSWQE